MPQQTDHVAIVGGGIIGAMSAWFISQTGRRVTIIDERGFGSACSHGNCGFICPSHVLPLPAPGAIRSTLPYLLQRNAPFRIKFRWSPAMWQWFLQFAKHCRADTMWATASARHALLSSSAQLYHQLITEEPIACEYEQRGLMFVYRDHHEFEEFRATATQLSERFGVQINAYDAEQLVEVEPALKSGLGGAWHFTGDCHLRPDKLMAGLREQLAARGVEFIEPAPFERFRATGRRADAVQVKGADGPAIEADAFVIATGAVTPLLNQHLGCRLNIQPGKGYTITMRHPPQVPTHPMIFEQDRVAVTPLQSGYRIGSTMEFAGYDTSIDPRRLEVLRRGARRYLHEPYADPVEEEWFGWRPMTWDGKPIIDRAPAYDNVWIAAGHNMLGLSMGAGTGKLVAELLSGEPTHLDPTPFRVDRFTPKKHRPAA